MIQIADDFPGYPIDMFCIAKHYEDDLTSVMIPGGFVQDRYVCVIVYVCTLIRNMLRNS